MLLRWVVEHYHLGSWGVLALSPLWFVAVLGSVNAFARELSRDRSRRWSKDSDNTVSSLGGLALLMVVWSMTWPVWPQ